MPQKQPPRFSQANINADKIMLMKSDIFNYGKWICPRRLAGLAPIDVYSSQFIKGEIHPSQELNNIRFYVKKRFNVNHVGPRAYIRVSADDYYKLYINGSFVGQGPAQGYHTCYYWNEFDVTALIKDGENEICADVYYQGLINRAYQSGDGRLGFIAELYLNSDCVLYTDSSWESAFIKGYAPSHIIGMNTMFSGNFDARAGISEWQPCSEIVTDHIFSPYPAKPLQVYEKQPLAVEPLKTGGCLYDFGEEITGTLRISARGEAGLRIRILCGEELDDCGNVRYNMRCGCLCEEYWTLAGGGGDYEQYDYRGFRYAAVIPQEGVEITSVKAIVRHYPFDDGYCELETSSPILKGVWDICKNGVKYGSQECFVDCPTREKGQYAGDLTVTSASHLILTGDTSLLKKGIDNQMQSAKIRKGLLAVTPGSFLQEIADYSFQFPILALRYYNAVGDKEYLKENLSVCEGIISHFGKYARGDGLLCRVTDEWNLVDWPDNLRDGYDFPPKESVEPHNVINAFYIGCVIETEQIRDILGVSCKKVSPALIAAFNREFYDAESGLYRDRQGSSHIALHSNILPAFYGFIKQGSRRAIGDFIVKKGLSCGVYMAYFLLKALCRLGRYMDAYSLIVSTGEHSWYNMLREGATTCFEAWGKEQKWNTSLCHPWASAPISVLAEDILPIHPELGRIVYRKD